jgi:uroporphyrinogen decarboxylase
MASLNFQVPDRTPRDMAGMRSTSVSAFAYPALVKALGLPPRRPRVEDTGQMLALPDLDVLDALNIDVVTILDGVTNAFDQPEEWHEYNFNGRLPALVRRPQNFRDLPDGTIFQGNSQMPPSAYVFDELHAGQPLDFEVERYMVDLDKLRSDLLNRRLTDERIQSIRGLCKRVRESSDRAVFLNEGSVQLPIGIASYGGLAVFPVLCVSEPNYVADLHAVFLENTLANMKALLPEIADYFDILIIAADDWGTQANLIASPKVYKKLFLPYYQQVNAEVHRHAPQSKTFLHSCGAIYDILDPVIESGFDILNPVQWSAGGHSYQEWKAKANGRISLWGGGVNAQVTLPFGSVEDVAREAATVSQCLVQDGGYVFCNIHNLLAEVDPQKIIAMYQAAG